MSTAFSTITSTKSLFSYHFLCHDWTVAIQVHVIVSEVHRRCGHLKSFWCLMSSLLCSSLDRSRFAILFLTNAECGHMRKLETQNRTIFHPFRHNVHAKAKRLKFISCSPSLSVKLGILADSPYVHVCRICTSYAYVHSHWHRKINASLDPRTWGTSTVEWNTSTLLYYLVQYRKWSL